MDIQKERESFQKFCEENSDFERHEQTYFDEQTQCYENDIGEDTESINMAWMAWQAAKAQAVPQGYVLVPKEPTLKMSIAYQKNAIAPVSSLSISGYKAMITAAQEPAND